MADALIPHQEGLKSAGQSLDPAGLAPKYRLPTGAAKSLTDLLEEYAFFTPAVLYLYANFRDAPLIDFIHHIGGVRFYYKKFSRPIFRGLEARSNGNPDWNYALWAVERVYWPALSAWLVSLTLTYGDDGEVIGIGEQDLTVLDPLAAEAAAVYHPGLPALPVTAFGVNGSRFRAAFVSGPSLLTAPPTLTFYGPDPAMRAFAAALYAGDNPVHARDTNGGNK